MLSVLLSYFSFCYPFCVIIFFTIPPFFPENATHSNVVNKSLDQSVSGIPHIHILIGIGGVIALF
jgi:hypothetical protein